MIRAVLACDGQEGHFPCKQAQPVGVVLTAAEARKIAQREGWSTKLTAFVGRDATPVLDFCPACTKRQQLGKTMPKLKVCGHYEGRHSCECRVA